MQPQHLGDKAGGTGTQGQLWLSSKSEVSLDYLRLSQKQTNNQTKQKETHRQQNTQTWEKHSLSKVFVMQCEDLSSYS